MLMFAYTGRSAAGPVSGELEGSDASAVAGLLLSRGVTPLDIKATGQASTASGGAVANPLARWMEPKVQGTDLMLFSRQLHTLLRSGVPILRALAGLQESTANVAMRRTLAQVSSQN